MSGGFFEYSEYTTRENGDKMERFVLRQRRLAKEEPNPDGMEDAYYYNLSEQTLDRIENAAKFARLAADMMHEVDYLLSGDIGEESFHKGMDELEQL